MIKSDAQRKRTAARLETFRAARGKVRAETSGKRRVAILGSYDGIIRQLQAEVAEYDRLKQGKVRIPPIERLDQIAPYVTKIRIARGVSQTQLARLLGVSKQVINRWEESDYQVMAIPRLQNLLDKLGVKIRTRVIA